MTKADRERAALKIVEVIKPCLKKTRGKETGICLYSTTWGRKTEIGLAAVIETIIWRGGE